MLKKREMALYFDSRAPASGSEEKEDRMSLGVIQKKRRQRLVSGSMERGRMPCHYDRRKEEAIIAEEIGERRRDDA